MFMSHLLHRQLNCFHNLDFGVFHCYFNRIKCFHPLYTYLQRSLLWWFLINVLAFNLRFKLYFDIIAVIKCEPG
jgi:hypothetical protein